MLKKKQKSLPCGAVIVAAGSGTRMQGVDKLFTLLRGKPVIAHTISVFEESPCIQEIVIVARESQTAKMQELIAEYGFQKVRSVVPGGAERADSVRNGLKALSRKTELVAIQDGARPLVTGEIIRCGVAQAAQCHAAAPAIPVKDTIKITDETGRVIHTPERSSLRAVQTPQVFQKDLLMAAWEKARLENMYHTDDCGAMEAMGVPVYLTDGSEENLKITTRSDLYLALLILKEREEG